MDNIWLLIPLAAIVIAVVVVRRYMKWQDPSLSSKEKQAEARMWSNRHGGR